MAYRDFKDLAKRIAADKVLRDKAFNIAKDSNYDGYQRGLTSMVYKCFNKKTAGSGINLCPKMNNYLKDFINPLLKNSKKEKCIQHSKTIFYGADLAYMQLISKFNKRFRFLLCVIDIFSKYAWVVLLKDKKCVGIVNAFQRIFKKSNKKPNKVWVDK